MKAGNFYFIHLADEAPNLGSGRRIVFIHSIGSQWVKLRTLGGLFPATVPIRLWGPLARSAQPVSVSKARIKSAISLKRRAGVKITNAMKELLQ